MNNIILIITIMHTKNKYKSSEWILNTLKECRHEENDFCALKNKIILENYYAHIFPIKY